MSTAKVISLLALSDRQGAQSVETYIKAAELLFKGFDKDKHGSLRKYMQLVAAESVRRGHSYGRTVFFNLWGVGRALHEKLVKRADLTECETRAELLRTVPRKTRNDGRAHRAQVAIRISHQGHKQLMALAARFNETLADAVDRLLASQAPAVRKASASRKAA